MCFSSGRVSPSSYSLAAIGSAAAPEPPQRRSFSRLLQSQQQRPTSEIFESRHHQQQQQQRQEALTPTPTSTMPSYRFDQYQQQQQQQHQRPITPLSQKSRPKSPSLQSLKNGFRKATNCVRRPQGSDGSDGEGDMIKPAASLISMQPSTTTNSSSLYTAISKPTPVNINVNNNNNNNKRYEEIDAVEEAIRSLESFGKLHIFL
uniref:Uncharacterized protein n=1 Tax=Panagrolaimus superbus TaxID=310955 RepID=A0A914YLV0_9BILA